MPAFSSGQLNTARGSSHYEHTYSISEMPERVRLLAEEITEGHTAPYAKAMAIEQHLKTNYTYRFADPLTGGYRFADPLTGGIPLEIWPESGGGRAGGYTWSQQE